MTINVPLMFDVPLLNLESQEETEKPSFSAIVSHSSSVRSKVGKLKTRNVFQRCFAMPKGWMLLWWCCMLRVVMMPCPSSLCLQEQPQSPGCIGSSLGLQKEEACNTKKLTGVSFEGCSKVAQARGHIGRGVDVFGQCCVLISCFSDSRFSIGIYRCCRYCFNDMNNSNVL